MRSDLRAVEVPSGGDLIAAGGGRVAGEAGAAGAFNVAAGGSTSTSRSKPQPVDDSFGLGGAAGAAGANGVAGADNSLNSSGTVAVLGAGDCAGAAGAGATSGISILSAMPSSRNRKAFLQVVHRTARPTNTGLRGYEAAQYGQAKVAVIVSALSKRL